jgi:filamentous hemagglutinin family protein
MKRFAMMAAAAVLAAGCGSNSSPASPSAPPNSITFTAALNPANEVPPVTNADATGSGSGTFKLDLTRDSAGAITAAKATFVFSLTGFPAGTNVILGHIHTGGPGVTGSPIVSTGLTAANPVVLANGSVTNQTIGNIDVTPTNAQLIIDNPNGYYYNLHTTLNPGGAVRAQLVKQ